MKKLLLGALIFALVGCGSEQPEEKEQSKLVSRTAPPVELSIIKDERMRSVKRTVEVVLPNRVDEETLRQVAQYINEEAQSSFERTFIGYHIEGERPGVYWATTHYNPSLDVKIIGSTEEEHGKLSQPSNAPGTVKGRWRLSMGFDSQLVMYELDGKAFMRSIYGDGSSSDKELTLSQSGGRKVAKEVGNQHGEYFVIAESGDLELWGNNGRFATATKL